MASYSSFAYIYDSLTMDVEYEKRADYLEELFKKHFGRKPELVCELGCGTGTMCNILSDRDYDMIGIDMSESMLDVAMQKSMGKNILYLNQDMREFELYGTVDVIICLLDSFNYITDIKDLEHIFALCKNYLNPDGLLIFDINTKYKFENVLSDNTFTYDSEEVFYVWENNYDSETKLCEFFLTFFVEDDGKYERIDEYHVERCYEDNEIENALKNAGFDNVKRYGDMTLEMPKNDEERVFYLVKK